MKKLAVIVLPIATLFLALQAGAAPRKKNALTQKERQAMSEVSTENLKSTFKNFLKALSQQDKSPSPASLKIIKKRIDHYLELPFFEADTGLQKKWLAQVLKGMQAVVDIQVKRVLSNMIHNKEQESQSMAKLDAARAKLEKLMKHPDKVSPKQLIALRKKANKARLAIRKKLEASGGNLLPPGNTTTTKPK